MAADSSQNSFRRGVMSLVILGLLQKEDMYGYQLVQQTQIRSGGRIRTQEGSLYPVLYKLVDQGLISDKRVQVGKRMTRVYYHLEPAGEQRFRELLAEYEQISQGIFMIAKGVDEHCEQTAPFVVPSPGEAGTAGQLEGEEKHPAPNGELHPGLCF